MATPTLLRYAAQLRYDQPRGSLAVLDWPAGRAGDSFSEYGSAEQLAQALAERRVDPRAAPLLAGYALALAAHGWAGRPTEARRAALIQAGEWLRQARPGDHALARALEPALALADQLALAGGDAEAALAQHAAAAISRADRVAERCGRIAAGLLDEHDHILTHGYAGPALGWLLSAALAEGKAARLSVAGDPGDGQVALALAAELGLPAELAPAAALTQALAAHTYTICLVAAERIALDGSLAVARGAAAMLSQARAARLPCYALSYAGPDASCHGQAQLAAELGAHELAPPELIGAIITHRGIYRPEMVARFLGDSDAPLETIPLQG